MRRISASATASLFVVACLCAAVSSEANFAPEESPEPKTIMLYRGEKWMLDYTNYFRKLHGLSEVVIDPKLQESCRRHCIWMARNNSMTHSGAGGENIAAGQASVADAMNTWRADGPHWVQIVNPGHRVCGMACYQMPNGQRYFCQQFGP
jgi:uncharacterized protein YkwD